MTIDLEGTSLEEDPDMFFFESESTKSNILTLPLFRVNQIWAVKELERKNEITREQCRRRVAFWCGKPESEIKGSSEPTDSDTSLVYTEEDKEKLVLERKMLPNSDLAVDFDIPMFSDQDFPPLPVLREYES